MINALMNDTVVIVRMGDSTDSEYGRPSRAELSRALTRGRIEQRGSREEESFTVDTWRVALPIDSVIDAGDVIEYEGKRFDVISAPDRLTIPGFSGLDRVEVDLRYVGRLDAA